MPIFFLKEKLFCFCKLPEKNDNKTPDSFSLLIDNCAQLIKEQVHTSA